MTGFDAERYLRTLGERALLGGEDEDRESPQVSAAQALVAVGAATEAQADEVLRDYQAAQALREGDYHARIAFAASRGPAAARPLLPRRVLTCDTRLASGLHLRYVSLAEDETVIGVRFAPPRTAMPPMIARRRARAHWGPPEPDVADDRGGTATAHFSGGGGMDEWVGRLTADRPLAVDTAWIEVDGERIPLDRPAIVAAVAIEPLPEADPALRHLRRVALGSRRHHHEGGFDHAVDALVAAGALPAADPRVAPLRHAVNGGHGRRLPEPWRSLRQGGDDGRPGTMALAAVTPEFDGIEVAVAALDAHEGHWSIEVEVTPATALHDWFGAAGARLRSLAWWAADDRGHRYAGEVGNSGGGDDRAGGQVMFDAALDPTATRVEIAAIADRHQALIRFPLEWT